MELIQENPKLIITIILGTIITVIIAKYLLETVIENKKQLIIATIIITIITPIIFIKVINTIENKNKITEINTITKTKTFKCIKCKTNIIIPIESNDLTCPNCKNKK